MFDISFNKTGNAFVSVGADCQLRSFDIRDLAKSNILNDTENDDPFVRVCWNKNDANQISMISMKSNNIYLYDISALGV